MIAIYAKKKIIKHSTIFLVIIQLVRKDCIKIHLMELSGFAKNAIKHARLAF
jgi:hypothetical protein